MENKISSKAKANQQHKQLPETLADDNGIVEGTTDAITWSLALAMTAPSETKREECMAIAESQNVRLVEHLQDRAAQLVDDGFVE